jgi:uncharacterized protein (TIGR03435 family)
MEPQRIAADIRPARTARSLQALHRSPSASQAIGEARQTRPWGFRHFIAVSLYTATEEQLGLFLANDRAQVEVLVLDSVQMPRPD